MKTRYGALVALLLLVIAAGAAFAQGDDDRLTFDFKDAKVKDILDSLNAIAGIQYVLDEPVGDKVVTVSLREQPINAALTVVLGAAELTYVYDDATSIYHVKSKPKRTTTQRTNRPESRPTVTDPAAPVRGGTAGAAGTGAEAEDEEDEQVTRKIQVYFQDATLMALLAGGTAIGSNMLQGGGGGGGYGGGGYGGGGGGYGGGGRGGGGGYGGGGNRGGGNRGGGNRGGGNRGGGNRGGGGGGYGRY